MKRDQSIFRTAFATIFLLLSQLSPASHQLSESVRFVLYNSSPKIGRTVIRNMLLCAKVSVHQTQILHRFMFFGIRLPSYLSRFQNRRTKWKRQTTIAGRAQQLREHAVHHQNGCPALLSFSRNEPLDFGEPHFPKNSEERVTDTTNDKLQLSVRNSRTFPPDPNMQNMAFQITGSFGQRMIAALPQYFYC